MLFEGVQQRYGFEKKENRTKKGRFWLSAPIANKL